MEALPLLMIHLFQSQMKMLWKITDCESLEISQENVYDRVSFSKNTNLQCSDCSFGIKRTHHRFFLEYLARLVSRFACNTRVIVDASSSPPVSHMSNSCNKTLTQINK